MRVTHGQPEACGERSDFPQAGFSSYRALWVYHSDLWRTGHTSNYRSAGHLSDNKQAKQSQSDCLDFRQKRKHLKKKKKGNDKN